MAVRSRVVWKRRWTLSNALLVVLMCQQLMIDDGAAVPVGTPEGGLTPEQIKGKIERLGKKIVYEDPQDENGDLDSEDQEPASEDSLLNFGGGGFGENLLGDEGKKLLKCWVCDPPLCEDKLECTKAVTCFKSRSMDAFGHEQMNRGCIEDETRIKLQCATKAHAKSSTQTHNTSTDYGHTPAYAIECCNDKDFCNDGDFPELPSTHQEELHPKLESETTYLIGAIVFAIVVFLVIIFVTWRCLEKIHRKRMDELNKERHRENFFPLMEDQLQAKSAGDSTMKEYIDGSITSGSGSGLPLLVQRTLAKNILLKERVGKGKYGEVWRGVYNCEQVAVKSFSTVDEASWTRETEIYSTVMLRHNNILGFYGSDMTSINSSTQLWLVTHYHKNGSLYDYLNKREISQVGLIKLAYSLANGLAFLHSEMIGTESRAGIAHRDIKSKNILVSANEYCVIADFGLAVTHKRETGELCLGQNPKAGTKRYMAPEQLDDSINTNTNSFDSFKRMDMYAFALVLWEMCRRTISLGIADDYQPPYYDVVNADPSFDEMRKVVCVDGYRPEIPNRWSSDPVLLSFSKLMKECWHANPSVRLSALRVKKSIFRIAKDTNQKAFNDIVTT